MENHKITKMSGLFLTVLVISSALMGLRYGNSYTEPALSQLVKKIGQKLSAFYNHLPEERIYLHTSQPFYQPGDDLWFSVYLRNGTDLKASTTSDIVYVQLLNPKGGVEQEHKLIVRKGIVAGDFNLGSDLPGGIYKIKAFTNWMKNESEENVFCKEIQIQNVVLPALKMKLDFTKKAYGPGDLVISELKIVTNENEALATHKLKLKLNVDGKTIKEFESITDQEGVAVLQFTLPQNLRSSDGLLNIMIDYNGSTESISRSIPIILNKIELAFFPEGGDLVDDLTSRVAFKATNEFGKPADIEGIVYENESTELVKLSSIHNGMGSFILKPQPGKSYSVKITKPAGINQLFLLPERLERGSVLNVTQSALSALEVKINSSRTDVMTLIAQVRGKIFFSGDYKVSGNQVTCKIPLDSFPAGVAQLTLFDSKGIARAERLVFVNKDKRLQVLVTTDKQKYLPREKVKMNISVRDENGIPCPARLSLAVVDDQLLSFADDRSGNLLSAFLLEQDLNSKVEEPAFYFDPTQKNTDLALDHLLMTAGWRRFTWEKIMENELPVLKYESEKAIISGHVIDGHTYKPMPGATLKTSTGQILHTDADGRFSIIKADLNAPFNITVSNSGFQDQHFVLNEYAQNMELVLYRHNYRVFSKRKNTGLEMQLNDVPQDMVMNAAAVKVEMFEEEAAPKIQQLEKKEAIKKPVVEQQKMPEQVVGRVLAKQMAAEADMDVAPGTKYYRARQFVTSKYESTGQVQLRTDFRKTIYWNPDIEIGSSGKKTIEFFTSDDITSFRITTEGISNDGLPGRSENVLYTQLPFQLKVKLPVELVCGDRVSIPVTLSNNTGKPIGGILEVLQPAGFVLNRDFEKGQTIMPGQSKVLHLDYTVGNNTGTVNIAVAFKSCGLSDAIVSVLRVVPRGFPASISFAGQFLEKEYDFTIKNSVPGSMNIEVSAFPNVVNDMVSGIEGILQEPYGCFEQTSCTAYPNAMVLEYLKRTGTENNKLLARATELLDKGYKRLTTFESEGNGYEWFGANPAHEGLTAYGIMEFADMQKAGQEIDKKMFDRTVRWLLSHRDGKGGFVRQQHALHDFGRISDEVLNAYIVYALTEAGFTDLTKEFESCYQRAMSSEDPYLLGLMSNAAFNLKEDVKANKCLQLIKKKLANDGSVTGNTHSITYSQGLSLKIETTSLFVMALLRAEEKDRTTINKTVSYLISARSAGGAFSSTQGTILALKALSQHAVFSKRIVEDGQLTIYIDGVAVDKRTFKAGEKNTITMAGLQKYIHVDGRHRIKIRFEGMKEALPYSVAVRYNSFLPESSGQSDVVITTNLSASKVKAGETTRLTVNIQNKRNAGIPSVSAIIGIPAGLSLQPWQLKELQEKNAFAYYEIKGNKLLLYYRGMAANAAQQINFDLKADIPGNYTAAASSAYLYYTNEYKSWAAGEEIVILP